VHAHLFTWGQKQIQFPKRCDLLGIPDDGQSVDIHSVFIANTGLLMLLRETVAVYCENRKKHIDILCGQNAEF
jgi:hypothetical protein